MEYQSRWATNRVSGSVVWMLAALSFLGASMGMASERGIRLEPLAPTAPGGNAALFVGVNQFTEDKALRPLEFAVNDAIAQAHLFVVELKLVPAGNAWLALSGEPTTPAARAQLSALESAGVQRVSATKSTLLRALQTVANISRDPADLVLVSLSSHGFEERGVAYVMPADGIRGFLEDTAVNLGSVEQRLAQSKAGKRLLLIDACRERPRTDTKDIGVGMSAAFWAALATAEGQAVLASCDAGQVSLENRQLQHGVFTYFLLEALRGGAAADGEGLIRLGAVSEYVARAVQEWVVRTEPGVEKSAMQRPWFKGPKVAEQIPLAMDAGITARRRAFQADIAQTVEALKLKINRKGEFNLALYDRLAEALEQAADDEAGGKLLRNAKEFVAGKVNEEMFVAYLERTLETPAQRQARLQREAAERAAREQQVKIAELLATARANDNRANGKTALAALAELLRLDPGNAEARSLQAKISAYYGPSKDAPWVNSLGMKFVPVPGTDVLFCIWETRVQDYQAFVSATGREWPKPDFVQDRTHPAVNVSWEDAKAFCDWLTSKERREGWLGAGREYRLPTDAEWSLASGLGTEQGNTPQERDRKIKGVYPWDRQWPPPLGAGNYNPRLKVDDYVYTSPVGSFAANRFGLFGMGGNVWEWCEDLYSPGWNSRVLRGASWYSYDLDDLLSSCRNRNDPDFRGDRLGFRCVLADASSSR